MKQRFLYLLAAGCLAVSCGDKPSDSTTTESPTTDPTTAGPGTSTTTATTTGTTTSPTTTDGTATGTGTTDDCNFVCTPDTPDGVVECDIWEQDCPEGEKCMPWANDGGNSWNSTKCSPVADGAGVLGDECMVEGSGVSGVDNCGVGLFCYYLNEGVGTCIEMCTGSPENKMCSQMSDVCTVTNGGVLILCRPKCDPVLQDCEFEGTACLPAAGSDNFTCIIDASGDAGAFNDPCEFTNSCDPGLMCLDASAFADCQAGGCCSEYCDLNAPNTCTGMPDGQECVGYYEMGTEPPEYAHVGVCAIPA